MSMGLDEQFVKAVGYWRAGRQLTGVILHSPSTE